MGLKETASRRWAQIKAFPYLLPTLIRLRLGRERPFLDIPRGDSFESTSAFYKQMLGPLVISFFDWSKKSLRDPATGQLNRDLFAYLEGESHTVIADRIMGLRMVQNFNTIRELEKINGYKSWADDCPHITNQVDLANAVESWESLMLEHTWEEIVPGQPRIANLYHIGVHGAPQLLPYTLILNGKPHFRIFGHYYVPKDYLNSKGAKAFFDHIAKNGQFDELYDREHKELVTRRLLWPIMGKKRNDQEMTILEVGCGDGSFGDIVNKMGGLPKHSQLFGVDVSPEMFPQIEASGNYSKVAELNIANTTKQKLMNLFQVNGFTDVVLPFVDFWLSHEERKKTYKLIYEILPEGGSLSFDVHHPDEILSEPNYKSILLVAGFKNVNFSIKRVPAKDGEARKVGIVFAFK